jgi:hypothetical protein
MEYGRLFWRAKCLNCVIEQFHSEYHSSIRTEMKKIIATLTVGLAGVSGLFAQQDIVSFSSINPLNTFNNGTSYTLGYQFTVTSPITVTGLSAFTVIPSLGLNENTPVGLWNSSGTQLAGATVLAGTTDPLTSDGFFRYASLASAVVLPDGTYYVGAEVEGFTDDYTFAVNGLTSIPGVTFVQDAFAFGSTLSDPSANTAGLTAADGGGFFGGNVVVGGPVSSVSVPDASSSLALLSGVCVALGAVRRKLT